MKLAKRVKSIELKKTLPSQNRFIFWNANWKYHFTKTIDRIMLALLLLEDFLML